MSDKNVKIKQKLKFTEFVNAKDFFPLKKDVNGDDRWARVEDLKDYVIAEIEFPTPTTESINSYMIDYGTSVVLDAVWYAGNLQGRISTETNTVEHTVPRKWHISFVDLHGNNLDDTSVYSESLFDYIPFATDGATVFFKV